MCQRLLAALRVCCLNSIKVLLMTAYTLTIQSIHDKAATFYNNVIIIHSKDIVLSPHEIHSCITYTGLVCINISVLFGSGDIADTQ